MMMAAQLHKVLETRFAAIGPVLYMVTIDESGVGTAWKAATPVPEPQSATNGRWDGPRLASD